MNKPILSCKYNRVSVWRNSVIKEQDQEAYNILRSFNKNNIFTEQYKICAIRYNILPTIKIFELFGWMPSTLSKNKFGMCVRGEGVPLHIRIMYFKNNVFLHLVTSIFQQVHQLLGQLLPAILGSYCYCCHVSMPGFILSFNFTHNCSKSIVLFKIKSKQFNYLYSEHGNRRKIM